MQSKSKLLRTLGCVLMLNIGLAVTTMAAPIYVYRESDGSVRFTDKRPPAGVTAKVFSARKSGFTRYRGNFAKLSDTYRIRGKVPGESARKNALKEAYNDIIKKVANYNRLDPALVKAVIHVESAFNPSAVSPKGAIGLMQLMPDRARLLGVRRPFHPTENIIGCTRHLADLVKRYNGNV
jgi:soluble lytic murein transglycosylase-like protein